MRILSIDSSLNDIGYSVMESNLGECPEQLLPSGTLRIKKRAPDMEKVRLIRNAIETLFDMNSKIPGEEEMIRKVLIEKATSFTYGKHQKGGKQQNAKAMAQNHFATGVIAGSVLIYTGIDKPSEYMEFLSAQDWKGMQAKIVTLRLVNYTYKLNLDEKKDHNEADAIGIGRWYIAQLKFQERMNK